MRLLVRSGPIIALIWGLIGACGCGKPSAKGVADVFVAAMVSGNTLAAAQHWDYVTYARKQNPDWDSFATSQKNLIIKEAKFAEKRAKELDYWKLHFPRGTEVDNIMEEGDSAIAQLKGGRAGEIHLIKIDNTWYVNQVK